ncbi:cupin domain-containing protein [Bremerella cremea]|uniref:Cupin type-2 domain-containing protein n=1 Tax=Blastopirellula marina TaxID=124 RepID=A0A2S8FVH4_9BACT|nr:MULTISPECIES: cupin domain-containing protein [Pirellulaceae]PQO36178.1 hypothetical protein C5Y83_09690 [Blastopirellula marina]RCS48855.1 cupin domain-containing protein [Bremerella cremea]
MDQRYGYVNAGPLDQWGGFRFQLRDMPPVPKRFLKSELNLTGMEVSLNCCPAGAGMPFAHKHCKNEEVYVFLTGEGEFQAGEDILPISPGACFSCPPEMTRAFRNTSSVPMEFIVIQAEAGTYSGSGETNDGEIVPNALVWGNASANS